MAWEKRLIVRFEDVDFAHFVFYPRLFQYCHWAFEDFFREEVGVPYAQMLQQRRVAYPTVHLESDFKAPLRFGEPVRIVLEALKLGTRSITTRYRLHNDAKQELAAEISVVTACMSMDTYSSVDMPDDVRAAFGRHLAR